MRLETRTLSQAAGTILLHNVADESGKRVLKKGILLTEEHTGQLAALGRTEVEVAALEADDVREDEAAGALATAMQTETLFFSRLLGGRSNLRTRVDGLLEIDVERLLALNMLQGITLATRRQYAVVGPNQETDNVATLKIVPYAVRRTDLHLALELASARPGILELRALPRGRRVAMLFVAESAAQERTRQQYLPPTQHRLERLGAEIVATEAVVQTEEAIAEAAARLVAASDLLIIAGQTSITHEEDTTLRALRRAGAVMTLSGAPVDPGSLLALAYFPGTPTGDTRTGRTPASDTPALCAPGCAKGLKRNVVDLVLPRLLLGDRLGRQEIAELGLGGFLTAAERSGQAT
jgi:hypothetical protein